MWIRQRHIIHPSQEALGFDRRWDGVRSSERERTVMKFGVHNPSWVYGPNAAMAFEWVKTKAQWAENHGFVWFSGMDHLIQIGGVGDKHGADTQDNPPSPIGGDGACRAVVGVG
jgi:hypothetical protein